MAHTEISSIETLINEDRNFCADQNVSQDQDISSWNFEKNLKVNSKLSKKNKMPLLPPIIGHYKSKTTSEVLINYSEAASEMLTNKSPDDFSKNHWNRPERNHEFRDKVKITQFKSLDDIAEMFNNAPVRNQFRPSIRSPKLKSLKQHKNREMAASESHKVNIALSNIDYPVSYIQKGKKTKKIIGLAYPPSYYEKFFVNSNMMQSVKHHINAIGLERPNKLTEEQKHYNLERVNDFLCKIQLPTLRSKSTLGSIFPEKPTLRNKYLLTPALKNDY